MAMRSVYRNSNLYYYDTDLSPRPGTSLWEGCPLLAILSNPTIGIVDDNQFMNVTPATSVIPGWTTTIATSGAVTVDTNLGLKIDSGAVTAGQGINLQRNSARFKCQAGKPIWQEARIKITGQASLKIQFALGLAAAGTTALIASNAMSSAEFAGFEGVTTTGVILSASTLSSTTGTGTGFTEANNGVYKLGMKITTTAIQFYVNDAIVSTLTANIPTAFLAPIICVQANATVQPIVYVERLRTVGLF